MSNTTLRIALAGPFRAVVAVTAALALSTHQPIHAVWRLTEVGDRCEIRDGLCTTLATSWARAVELHLAAPSPPASLRVYRPRGRG